MGIRDKKKCYGAKSAKTWQKIRTVFGVDITKDLLPVVSNPKARLSPSSSLKSFGKTPSRYNGRGEVVGFFKWNEGIATPKDIKDWSSVRDYGICIRTKLVRAIDIDIEDNEELIEDITNTISDLLGIEKSNLCMRYRENSTKILIPVILKNDKPIPKEIISFGEDGNIEFLADGQQFIAVGTHPSGGRYRWFNLGKLPQIDLKTWKNIKATVCMLHGGELKRTRGTGERGTGELNLHKLEQDDTLKFLKEHGHILGEGPSGQVYITCPFEEEHTSESGISSTAYFPAGTGGYQQGHFVCLHAHCADREDIDFKTKLGVIQKDFEVVEIKEQKEGYAGEPIGYIDRTKDGRPKAVLNNLRMALQRPDVCGYHIANDNFLGRIVLRQCKVLQDGRLQYGRFELLEDYHYTDIQMRLELQQGFTPISKALMRDVVDWVANQTQIDSLKSWIESLKWDGVNRIDTFISKYYGGEDNEYTRAVGAYMWTALAGRAVEPGVKADMAVILYGKQGMLKSSAISTLAPRPELYTSYKLGLDEDKATRILLGKCVVELPELRGLKSAKLEEIKDDIVKSYNRYRKLYKEHMSDYKRRCIFIGTTNEHDILSDHTGNRRWLPYEVVDRLKLDMIAADREQLWAEGLARFKANGVEWQDAERLAVEEHKKFIVRDNWEDRIMEWWEYELSNGRGKVGDEHRYVNKACREFGAWTSLSEVMTNALGISISRQDYKSQARTKVCLRKLGFDYRKIQKENKRFYAWVYVQKSEPKSEPK